MAPRNELEILDNFINRIGRFLSMNIILRHNEMIIKSFFVIFFFSLVICSNGYCVPEYVEKGEIYGTATTEADSMSVAGPVNFLKITQWIKALGLVLIVIIVGIFLLRKKLGMKTGLTGRKRYIHVVESVSLGSKKSIHLIKVPGKVLLIGVTNERIQSLSEITEKDIVDSIVSESKSGEFLSIFKRACTGT